MMSPILLYLHGFNSSNLSEKARIMREYTETHRPDIKVIVPQLPCYPGETQAFLTDLMAKYPHRQIGVVGSSLGGFLATWLHQHYGVRAVLINPAVAPYDLLQDYLGEQVNPYTQERYFLEPKHMDELKALAVGKLSEPSSLWLLQQEGDEVLDYRQAIERYQDCKQTVEPNGNHAFVDFERHCASILTFLF